jgi:Zn finger protein HypA/HybF involved in hydrogenase expression
VCGSYLVAMQARRRIEYGEVVQRCHACGTKLGAEPLPPPGKQQSEGAPLTVKCYRCDVENELRVGKTRCPIDKSE